MGIDDRPAIPSSSTAQPLGPPAVVQPANDDNFDDFMDYDDLEQVDAKEVEGFPERFRFLLGLDAISERVLRAYPDVYNLIAFNQTTVHMIIEKEIAMVCLLWAQSFIDCRTPIVEDAPLTFVGHKAYRPEGAQQGGKSMCRVLFRIPIPRHSRQESKRTQPPKKGMVVVIKGPNEWKESTPDEYMDRRNAHKETWLMRYIPVNTLTNDQQDAVFAICNKEHGNLPFLVHGPPGTGKTCTISAAIKVLLQLSAANRILEMRPYKRDPRMCTLLSECFRCPRPLVVLASTLFYDGKLKYAGDHDAEGLINFCKKYGGYKKWKESSSVC
ncbi:RNA helicase [Aphelenchoides fujianensis]|nr:RNA helicase [Aphelenchoides fujianensis]